MLAASVTRAFAAASVIGNALNLFQIMSAGFLVVSVPPYVWWIRWISPYFYSFRMFTPEKSGYDLETTQNVLIFQESWLLRNSAIERLTARPIL